MNNNNNNNIPINILGGIHHVTAITSSAEKIYDFYTEIMGMRLVKKTVNQDDIQTYHLFFADDRGNAGTDITFFDFQGINSHRRGTDDISRTGFRVPSDEAISYWQKRFTQYNVLQEKVRELFGRKVLYFEDFDGQQYAIFSDENDRGVTAGEPWHKGPVPDEYAIHGLGPVFLRVHDAELDSWRELFDRVNLPNSGFVDRFYFKSVYIRLYPNILFELATDGPGFIDADESYENLGETLDLPPHLKHKRQEIEASVRHFDTIRSTRTFDKEYF